MEQFIFWMLQRCHSRAAFSHEVQWLPSNQPSHVSATYMNCVRERAGEMASSAHGAAARNLHACTLFPHSHVSLVPLMPTANFCTGEDRCIQRAALSPTSCCGQACFGDGGRQTTGRSRDELAPGQAAYGSASAVPYPRPLHARMGPMGVCCWISVPQ